MKNQFVHLAKYKGDFRGEFVKVWIATDASGNFFTTKDLQFKQNANDFEPDFEATKWTSISNEYHHMITNELLLIDSNTINQKA